MAADSKSVRQSSDGFRKTAKHSASPQQPVSQKCASKSSIPFDIGRKLPDDGLAQPSGLRTSDIIEKNSSSPGKRAHHSDEQEHRVTSPDLPNVQTNVSGDDLTQSLARLLGPKDRFFRIPEISIRHAVGVTPQPPTPVTPKDSRLISSKDDSGSSAKKLVPLEEAGDTEKQKPKLQDHPLPSEKTTPTSLLRGVTTGDCSASPVGAQQLKSHSSHSHIESLHQPGEVAHSSNQKLATLNMKLFGSSELSSSSSESSDEDEEGLIEKPIAEAREEPRTHSAQPKKPLPSSGSLPSGGGLVAPARKTGRYAIQQQPQSKSHDEKVNRVKNSLPQLSLEPPSKSDHTPSTPQKNSLKNTDDISSIYKNITLPSPLAQLMSPVGFPAEFLRSSVENLSSASVPQTVTVSDVPVVAAGTTTTTAAAATVTSTTTTTVTATAKTQNNVSASPSKSAAIAQPPANWGLSNFAPTDRQTKPPVSVSPTKNAASSTRKAANLVKTETDEKLASSSSAPEPVPLKQSPKRKIKASKDNGADHQSKSSDHALSPSTSQSTAVRRQLFVPSESQPEAAAASSSSTNSEKSSNVITHDSNTDTAVAPSTSSDSLSQPSRPPKVQRVVGPTTQNHHQPAAPSNTGESHSVVGKHEKSSHVLSGNGDVAAVANVKEEAAVTSSPAIASKGEKKAPTVISSTTATVAATKSSKSSATSPIKDLGGDASGGRRQPAIQQCDVYSDTSDLYKQICATKLVQTNNDDMSLRFPNEKMVDGYSQTSWDLRAAFSTNTGVQAGASCISAFVETYVQTEGSGANVNEPTSGSDNFGPSAPKQARRETACVQPLSLSSAAAAQKSAAASSPSEAVSAAEQALRSKFTIKPKGTANGLIGSSSSSSQSTANQLETSRSSATTGTDRLRSVDWRGTFTDQTLQSEKTYFERGRMSKREADQEFPKQRNLDAFCIYLDAMLAFLLQVCAHESTHGKAESKRRAQLLTFIDEALSKCAPTALDLNVDPRWNIPLVLCHQAKAILAAGLYDMQSKDALSSASVLDKAISSSGNKHKNVGANSESTPHDSAGNSNGNGHSPPASVGSTSSSSSGVVVSSNNKGSGSSSATGTVSLSQMSKSIELVTGAFKLLDSSRNSWNRAEELAERHKQFFERFSPPLNSRASLLDLASYLDRCVAEFRALRSATGSSSSTTTNTNSGGNSNSNVNSVGSAAHDMPSMLSSAKHPKLVRPSDRQGCK